MFKSNIKIALRNLIHNWGFTFINVGGLAIGLACCLILLLYISYEFSYDRNFKDSDRTFIAFTNSHANGKTFSFATTPGLLAPELKENVAGVSNASRASNPIKGLISIGERGLKESGMFVDPSFLKIFNYQYIYGSPKNILSDVNTVVLTKTLSLKLFGAMNPVNKTIKLENNDVLKVEAVIEDPKANSSIKFAYLMPWKLYEKRESWITGVGWSSNFCLTIVQLENSDLLTKVNLQIKDIYQNHDNDFTTNEAFLHPLTKWHLYSDFENGKFVGGKIDQLRILILLSLCILLIACFNFMNLSTAKSEKRAKEVGIRKAMGSSRKSLISLFLTESMLISLFASLVAFILVEASLGYFNSLLMVDLTINYYSWKSWAAITFLTLFTGLIAGSYPAFYLSSFEPVKVLKGLKSKVGSSFLVRKVLVVSQFVFAACIIIFTSFIFLQLNFIKNKPIGYDNSNLIEIPIQANLRDRNKFDFLKDGLLKSGAAINLTTFSMPINEAGTNTNDITWEGKNPNSKILFNIRGIGKDFLETINVNMLSGRTFSDEFLSDSNNVVFNEAAIKIMGLKDPVGKTIKWGGSQNHIIGVMKDFVVESPYQKVAPMVFYTQPKFLNGVILIKLNPQNNAISAIAKIDELVKSINPDYPIERSFVNEAFEQKFTNEKLLGTLSNWFGGFAVLISCLGLLGLALFMAEMRKKEIGIRKTLGATTGNILAMLNKDFIKLITLSNAIALPLAYILSSKWLASFEYRVPISVLPFVAALIISSAIAVITVSIQSIKIAKSNPIDALKYE